MRDELMFWWRHPELPFALVCAIAIAALSGCAKAPEAASSSVPKEKAQLAARSVALLTGGRVCSVAPTGSMVPTFDANAFIVTEPVDLGRVRAGDIVVRTDGADGRLIVHRVMTVTKTGLVTRGDANHSDDPGFVDQGKLYGRVVAVIYGTHSP